MSRVFLVDLGLVYTYLRWYLPLSRRHSIYNFVVSLEGLGRGEQGSRGVS